RLRLCRRRRQGVARGAGSALARSAVHSGARPDRRPAGLRENAGAARCPVRPAHRLQLSGAGPEAEQAFQGLTVIAKSQRVPPSAGPMINSATKQSILPCGTMECFAEPVIGRRIRATRWLAMTTDIGLQPIKIDPGVNMSDGQGGAREAQWLKWRSVAELYHACFTGLILSVVTRRGTSDAA